MNYQDLQKEESTLNSIIVISDTHFGRGVGNKPSDQPSVLVKFLDWIDNNREILLKNNEKTKIDFPRAIVLLGDIFEFWAPLSEKLILDRSYMFIDKILAIKEKGCKIIYVVGNHDTIMRRYQGDFDSETSKDLKIVRKHEEIISSNGMSLLFVFVHGDQFEWGATNGISTKLMGYVYRIVSDLSIKAKIAVPVVFGACSYVLLSSQIQSISILREFLFVLLGALGLYAIPTLIWWAGLGVIALSVTIKSITSRKQKESIFNQSWKQRVQATKERFNIGIREKAFHTKPKYKKLKQVVEGSARNLFYSLEKWWKKNYNKREPKPDVIVFGHTHTPEGPDSVENISEKKFDKKLMKTILVNTGSWIDEGEERNSNFLYIDCNGKMILCEYDAEKGIGIELNKTDQKLKKRIL